MRDVQRAMKDISEEVLEVSKDLSAEHVDGFIKELLKSKRIFVIGAGRSGLVARAFAMRLMHLGLDTFVIGETTTPALHAEDVLVAVSGSGETSFVVSAANIAKKIGAKLATVTSYPTSALARMSDFVVTLPGRTKTETTSDFMHRELKGEYAPVAPLGTLFEIAALIFLDAVITGLMAALGKKEEDLRARHATIE